MKCVRRLLDGVCVCVYDRKCDECFYYFIFKTPCFALYFNAHHSFKFFSPKVAIGCVLSCSLWDHPWEMWQKTFHVVTHQPLLLYNHLFFSHPTRQSLNMLWICHLFCVWGDFLFFSLFCFYWKCLIQVNYTWQKSLQDVRALFFFVFFSACLQNLKRVGK